MTHQWTRKEIKAFREYLNMTKIQFAVKIGAGSIKTVSEWEDKTRTPSNSYCRVLDMVAMESDYIRPGQEKKK